MRFTCTLLFMICFACSAAALDNTMFNYQGRVLVQGMPQTGAGQMKVAIMATDGDAVASIWSNDGTSVAGSEPLGSFSVTCKNGVFDAMLGNTQAGMLPLPAILFNRNDELKVRVWFSDEIHGFQQLSPDQHLTNPRRMGITDLYSSTTLYVNANTGNDLNSGLSPLMAKKTIQAAVDMVPARLLNAMTVLVANGTYRESVNIAGIVSVDPYRMLILGDQTTTPSQTVSPQVRVTGTDNDTSRTKIRRDGFVITRCQNVDINGFLIDYYAENGVNLINSSSNVSQCKSSYNQYGITFRGGDYIASKSWCTNNYCGYRGLPRTDITIGNSGAANNTDFGLLSQGYCNTYLSGNNYFKGSIFGIALQNSYMWFESVSPGTTYIQNNNIGIQIYFHSSTRNIGVVSFSGNGTDQRLAYDSSAN